MITHTFDTRHLPPILLWQTNHSPELDVKAYIAPGIRRVFWIATDPLTGISGSAGRDRENAVDNLLEELACEARVNANANGMEV